MKMAQCKSVGRDPLKLLLFNILLKSDVACRDGGDPSKSVPYLPKDKQFLVTKNGEHHVFLQPKNLPST